MLVDEAIGLDGGPKFEYFNIFTKAAIDQTSYTEQYQYTFVYLIRLARENFSRRIKCDLKLI